MTSKSTTARSLTLVLGVLLSAMPAVAAADPAPLRTVWVDHNSRGGTCNDGYTASENASAQPPGSKPWCTLGAAGQRVIAGDLVNVRGGMYSEPMACGGLPACSGWAVLELVKKGTPAHPIVYKAYPGETPIIDPAGQTPGPNTGLIFGVLVGTSAPVGLCKSGSRKDLDCQADGDCTGAGAGSCDKAMSLNTVIDGFKMQNWSYYDARPTATNLNHNTSQTALMLHNAGAGGPADVTIRNGELANNNGGGALHADGVSRITFEYNKVHDNHTHGWTSAVNFWLVNGKAEGQNVLRGNTIYNNEDDPPLFCVPKYCSGGTDLTNRCGYDQYTNKDTTAKQGYGCTCGSDSQCQSGSCTARDCSSSTGGCECAGDTEGHGIILDVSGPKGAFLIESNVIYNNEGACINGFKSDNITARNNTCWKNNIRPGAPEITVFTNNSSFYNNIIVPRTGRRGIGMYYNTFVYNVDPASLSEGSNIVWSPDRNDVFEWGFGHSGTLLQYLTEIALTTFKLGRSTLNQSPQVVDGDGARDFRLLPGSPALGSADTANLAPTDVTGKPRSSADRGAYAGTTSALAPPVLLSVDPL